MKFLQKFVSTALALSLSLGCLATTGLAVESSSQPPDGYDEIITPGEHEVDISVTNPEADVKLYDYLIRIHYERVNGESFVDDIHGQASLNSIIPWEAEALESRTRNKINYTLAGYNAMNAVSSDTNKNIADLYYLEDADEDKIPDKYDDLKGNYYDYVITYDYNKGTHVERVVLNHQALGDVAIKSIEPSRTIGADNHTKTYYYYAINAESVIITPDKNKNQATIYYLSEDYIPSKPSTPINPAYPTWPYWPDYWHRPWTKPDANKPNTRPGHGEIVTKPETNKPDYKVDVETTKHLAYINGYPDGTVGPMRNITRGEVATILYRLMTADARKYYYANTCNFSDVGYYDWYNEAVCTVLNAGLITGYSDNTFKPNENITRAEFATVISRFLNDDGNMADTKFKDMTGHWAESYVNKLSALGWVSGYENQTFQPDAYITRAEAVTITNQLLQRVPEINHLHADMYRFPDNADPNAWYYLAIQEASNNHTWYYSEFHYEIWNSIIKS